MNSTAWTALVSAVVGGLTGLALHATLERRRKRLLRTCERCGLVVGHLVHVRLHDTPPGGPERKLLFSKRLCVDCRDLVLDAYDRRGGPIFDRRAGAMWENPLNPRPPFREDVHGDWLP